VDWLVHQTLAEDTTQYVDAGLIYGMTYSYRIKATNSFGDSTYSDITSKCLCVNSTTIRLQTTEEVDDAFLYSNYPDTNYGATQYEGVIERFAIKFNLPEDIVGQKIVEARLGLYGWNMTVPSPPHYLDLYEITKSWDETGITWNESQSGIAWTMRGGDFAIPAETRMELTDVDHDFFPTADITTLVQAWSDTPSDNNGLMVVNDTAATVGLKASEYNDNARSYLEITYAPVIPGDINDNGSVDLVDTIAGLRLLSEPESTGNLTKRADVNGDGQIGLAEVIFTLRALAGLVP
jgi:hypothetical protein